MSTSELRRKIPRKTGMVFAIGALLIAVGSTLAVHDATGPMELEGNLVDDSGGGTDWGAIFGADGLEVAANLPPGTLDTTDVIRDFVPGASGPDVSYHAPSNKDDQAISATGGSNVWGCTSVANPTDKTDIVNAYGAAIQGDAQTGDGDTADDQLFYFGVERFDNSGDAFIGIWLFQDDVTCNTATGKFEGSKRTGDILILANFTGGGSDATIQLFRYTAGVGTAAGSFGELVAVTSKCELDPSGDLPFPQNDLCATLNDVADVDTPWAMEDKVKPGPPNPDVAKRLEPDQFVEGGVNLTDVFASGTGGGTPPQCFGSFMAETRSSSSIDATLKDFALGNLDFCDANIEIDPDETNRVGEPHTFTVDVDQIVGSGEQAATVGDVEYTLTGSNGIVAGDIEVDAASTCINAAGVEDDLDAAGQCTIIVNSDVPGTITAHATVSVNVGGTLLVRQTNGLDGNSNDAVKTYVNATLDIEGDGTNDVGVDHRFTATLLADAGDGDGYQPVVGETVTISKTDDLGAVSVPSGDQTCVTDGNGQCFVEFTSNSTGTTTGTASADVRVPDVTGGKEFSVDSTTDATIEANQSVLKTWVDAKLDIAGDGTNRINDPHDFTVTAWADDGDGNGLHKVGGVLVTVAFAEADGTDPIGDLTCTTEDDDQDPDFGTCSVTFNSVTKTGTHTGTATADIPAGDITIEDVSTSADSTTTETADAVKTWVDAAIGIAGDDTNSIEEDHTFTVTVTKDLGDGAGPVAADGEDVDVTLANAGGADYVLDEALTTCDVVGDGDTYDHVGADTDTAGECVVVFTSFEAGTVTGSAVASVSVGGVPINLSTDDAGSTGDVLKTFLDGSIRWLKQDDEGASVGGATFLVCRTARLDSDTGQYVAEDTSTDPGNQPFCFVVKDNDGVHTTDPFDSDPDAGELEVIDLVLGQYNVTETIPPPGYHIQDPPGAGPFNFPDMSIEPAPPVLDVELDTIFINIKAFRIVVFTCDDITHTLVPSVITLDGTFGTDEESWSTVPTVLANLGVTEANLCGIDNGAVWGDLPDDTYTLSAIVPKAS